MNTKSKLKAISIGIAAIMMVSLLAAVTTVSASDVTNCWIGEDDNKVYFTIYSDAKAEGYICLNIVNGAYLERKKYGLNAGETATLSFREYRWNGVDDVEVCADCVDSCCDPSVPSPPPDLIVSEKWEESVNEGMIVHFKVTNIGEGDAGSSIACLNINGIYEGTVGVPALVAGASHVGAFAPESCPPGTTITVKVCADCTHMVDESDETNNCKTNEYPCPAPDLRVIKMSEEPVKTDGQVIVQFVIENIGDGYAGESYATLYIDDLVMGIQDVWVPALGPTGNYTSEFAAVDCTLGTPITVKVCADNTHVVEESDETNNCKQHQYTCPILPQPDLKVINISKEPVDGKVIVRFVVKNSGAADAGSSTACLEINGVQKDTAVVTMLTPGTSADGAFAAQNCPPGETMTITVCADNFKEVDESSETNNCMLIDYTCPIRPQPDLVVENEWEVCEDGQVIVHFIVKNNGTAEAGESEAALYIDRVRVQEQNVEVPVLGPGGTRSDVFEPVPCPPGTTITVKVCADDTKVVEESDETNNCMTNNFTCPILAKPDLVVIKMSEQPVRSDGHVIVHFTIQNNGTANAVASYATLYIGGVSVAPNVLVKALGPNGTCNGAFAAQVCPLDNNITVRVCADDTKVVDESDETNNCRTNNFTCPSQGPDLVINKTVTTTRWNSTMCNYTVDYTVTNIGNEIASFCCGNNSVALFVDSVLRLLDNDIPALGPGATQKGDFNWPACCDGTINFTVCADHNNVVDEGNESNNCDTNIVDCGLKGSITVNKTPNWSNVQVGEIVQFNGTVEYNNNCCCCNLTDITVTDTLPACLKFVSATPVGAQTGQTISWHVNSMDCGDQLNYTINATLESCCYEVVGVPGVPQSTNTMTANGTTCRGTLVSDSDTAWVRPDTKATMNVTKKVWNATSLAWEDHIWAHNFSSSGTDVQFRCTIHNNGTCTNLSTIRVTDLLPGSLAYNWSSKPYNLAATVTNMSNNETQLDWQFGSSTILTYCESIILTINATVVDGPDLETDTNRVDVRAYYTNWWDTPPTGGYINGADTAAVQRKPKP